MREDFIHYSALVWCQVRANLKAETSRAFLGMAWWLMEPLLYLSVFFFVFGVVFKRGGEGFVPFLLTGLVSFKWFSSSLMQGASSITKNANLINQVYLPKVIFPCIVVIMNTVKFLFVFAMLVPFLHFFGYPMSGAYFALPAVLFVQLLLNSAVAGVCASLVPVVPDLKVIIPSTIPMLLFLSGVIFDLSKVPESYQWVVRLNPMVTIIDSLRRILLYDAYPDWSSLGAVALCGAMLLALALFVLGKYNRRYPKLVS